MTGKFLNLRITGKGDEGSEVGIDDLITMLCIAKDLFVNPVVRLGKLDNYPYGPYLAVTSDGPNTTARRFTEPVASPTVTYVGTPAPAPLHTTLRTPWIATWPPTAPTQPTEPVAEPPVPEPVKPVMATMDVTIEYKHVCTDCERTFKTPAGLATHRNMMHAPKKAGHVCADCGRTYAKSSSLRTHRVRQHTEVPAPVVAMVPCPWCDRKFDDEFGRDIHVTAMHAAEQAKLQRVLGVVPEAELDPVVNISVPTADMGTMPKEYATNPVVGDKVVACTECDFVTHAATSELMQQHTFKVHKRIRNLTEKRPFVLGADDGGDAA